MSILLARVDNGSAAWDVDLYGVLAVAPGHVLRAVGVPAGLHAPEASVLLAVRAQDHLGTTRHYLLCQHRLLWNSKRDTLVRH